MVTNNAINLSSSGITVYNGTGTFFGRTLTPGTGISITNGDGIAGNPVISASGTVAQVFAGNAGTAVPSSGTLTISGVSPISTSGSGSTISISAAAATTVSLGVASFVSTNFLVTSGVVSLIGSVPLSFVENGSTTATPSGNALSVLGSGGIVTSGAGSTITISASGTIAQVFAGNAGTAVPSSGTLTISGVSPISTSGSGSTISISAAAATTVSLGVASFVSTNFLVTSGVVSLIGSVPLSFAENTGTATASAGVINIVGGAGIVTSGSASTITISSTGGGLTWQTTTTSVTAAANNGYIVTGGTVTITLPATIALGQVVDVLLDGGTAWVVKAPTGGTIVLGNALATTSILSGTNSTGDFVSLLAQTNTRWDAIDIIGNIGYS